MNPARAALGVTMMSFALLASGCAQPVEEPDDAQMMATPEQERRAPTQPAVRPPETVAEAQKAPVTASKKPEPEPETVVEQPAPAAPAYTASELMGKRQSEVTELMGEPARIEQRAASTVWVYQSGDCALDVFFFLDMATSDERVLTVAPSAESAAAAAQQPTPPAGETAAAETADAPQNPEDTAIDACYGKLRRS